MPTIKQLKKELGLTNKDLAGFFNMTLGSFQNSTAKKRYEDALCRFYDHLKAGEPILNVDSKRLIEIDKQNKKQ